MLLVHIVPSYLHEVAGVDPMLAFSRVYVLFFQLIAIVPIFKVGDELKGRFCIFFSLYDLFLRDVFLIIALFYIFIRLIITLRILLAAW